ncbi:hypothetical protein ACLOJK_005028 [Asimina triloba]
MELGTLPACGWEEDGFVRWRMGLPWITDWGLVRTMKMSPGDLGLLLAVGQSDLGLLIGEPKVMGLEMAMVETACCPSCVGEEARSCCGSPSVAADDEGDGTPSPPAAGSSHAAVVHRLGFGSRRQPWLPA